MKTLSLFCALALPASAQIFDWSFDTRLQGGSATVSGQITIDPDANTAALSGVIESPTHDYLYAHSQSTIIPGTFPIVEFSTVTASVTLTFADISIPFDTPPEVPTHYQNAIFRMPYSGPALSLSVAYDYVLDENGTPFASGSGSYTASGRPSVVYIDVSQYPIAVAVGMDGFAFYPVASETMFDETSPLGVRMSSQTLPIGLGVIPEPSTYGICFAATLAGLAIYRQSSRNTKKVLH